MTSMMSQPMTEGRLVDESLQLVTFEVASEEFAVDILAVHEINRMMELTRVPQAPREIEGVINLRGKIIPVMDLRKRFGLPHRERDEQTRIIVVEVSSRVIGFIVDRVRQVLPISRSIVEPAPDMVATIDSQFISGVGKLPDRLLILLDLDRLLNGALMDSVDKLADSTGTN
ncbi:MAG: chemotaxis protein CheW [Phycisphaeraceae bacterium]|nr:chemotaxis protein CheW [Phycisphaeraceae bacterium]